MSKELETIKSFQNKRTFDVTYDNGTQKHYETKTIGELFPKEINKIEAELKDYELLKERTKLDSFECLLRLEEILPRGKELLVPVAKQLNALEIIIVKRVDVQLLKDSKNFNDYNWCVHTKDRALSQGEYDFLKEFLK